MNWEDFPDDSRVWIYNSSQAFSNQEVESINLELARFCQDWTSHNNQLFASAKVFHNKFIILMLDESKAGASGCSIDKSVALIKNLQQKYGKDLFNRMNFSFVENGQVISMEKEQFKEAFENGKLNDDTIVFDHLVKTKKALQSEWTKPLKDSWHKRFV